MDVAHVLEGGVRGAAGELANLVPVVHHPLHLVRRAVRRRVPCRSQHTLSGRYTNFYWVMQHTDIEQDGVGLLGISSDWSGKLGSNGRKLKQAGVCQLGASMVS